MDTETDAAARLAAAAIRQPQIIEQGGRKFLIVPDNYNHHEITDPFGLATDPLAFIRQGVTLQAVDSLVDYTNRFKSEDTVLFADIANNRIVAIIDYHAPPEVISDTIAQQAGAAHGAHRAAMVLPFSEEWGTWKAISGKLMPQKEFARFLEENAGDVSAPSGADLLEICRDMQAVRQADFRRVVRTNGDDESFEYAENSEAKTKGGTVEVPTRFMLNIPVYFDSRYVEVSAFLRWKLDDGQLLLGIALHRPEHVRQAMFKEIVDDVGHRTECPVVYGAPDVPVGGAPSYLNRLSN